MSTTLVEWVWVLSLCREAVGVFYSIPSSRLSQLFYRCFVTRWRKNIKFEWFKRDMTGKGLYKFSYKSFCRKIVVLSIYICTDTHTCTHTSTYTYIHTRTHIHTLTYITLTHTHLLSQRHTYTHINLFTYRHSLSHSLTQSHTHRHTHS